MLICSIRNLRYRFVEFEVRLGFFNLDSFKSILIIKSFWGVRTIIFDEMSYSEHLNNFVVAFSSEECKNVPLW